DAVIVLYHTLRKPVYYKYFWRQVGCPNQFGEVSCRKIDVSRCEMSDSFPRGQVVFHGKLRVDTQVHMGHAQEGIQARQFRLQGAEPHLDVEEHKRIALLGYPEHGVDLAERHPCAVFAIAAGASLCSNRNI